MLLVQHGLRSGTFVRSCVSFGPCLSYGMSSHEPSVIASAHVRIPGHLLNEQGFFQYCLRSPYPQPRDPTRNKSCLNIHVRSLSLMPKQNKLFNQSVACADTMVKLPTLNLLKLLVMGT